MGSSGAEFAIPESVLSLLNDSSVDISLVEDAIDVTVLSAQEQIDTVNSIFRELQGRTSSIRMHFSKLLCFVRHIDTGNGPADGRDVTVYKETRAVLAQKLADCLHEFLRLVGRYLTGKDGCAAMEFIRSSSAATREADNKHLVEGAAAVERFLSACSKLRDATKLYCFIICQLLLGRGAISSEEANASQQPSALARRTAKKRGRGAPTRNAANADEDYSGLDTSIREVCLSALNEVISADLAPMWTNGRRPRGNGAGCCAVDSALSQLILKVVLNMISHPANIAGMDAGGGVADSNPVAVALLHLLSSLSARYTRTMCDAVTEKQDAKNEDGSIKPLEAADIARTYRSTLAVVIAPLLEHLLKTENALHCSRFVAQLFSNIDTALAGGDYEEEPVGQGDGPEEPTIADMWAPIFIGTFLRELTAIAQSDLFVGDSIAAKALAQLLEYLSRHRISILAIYYDAFVHPLLDCEAYEVRKAALSCETEIILQRLSGAGAETAAADGLFGLGALPGPVVQLVAPDAWDAHKKSLVSIPEISQTCNAEEERNRIVVSPAEADVEPLGADSVPVSQADPIKTLAPGALKHRHLRSLWLRLRDLNPFVRLHVLKLFGTLVQQQGCISRDMCLPVAREVVGRLNDRHFLVRKVALQLLIVIVGKNWFGSVLSVKQLVEARKEQITAARERFVMENAALRHEAPDSSQEEHNHDLKTLFDVFLDLRRAIISHVSEAMLAGSSVERASTTAIEEFCSTNSTINTTSEILEAEFTQKNLLILSKVLFYDEAVAFAQLITVALRRATDLLQSKNISDVVESISFITACTQSRVDNAVQAALLTFLLIFKEDLQIKIAVCQAFTEIFFNVSATALSAVTSTAGGGAESTALSTMREVRVLRFVQFMSQATEGDLCAISEVLDWMRRTARAGAEATTGGLATNTTYNGLQLVSTAYLRLVNEQFVNTVYEVLRSCGTSRPPMLVDEGSTPNIVSPVQREKRLLLRLYSMLIPAVPQEVALRKQDLVVLLDENSNDAVFVGHMFEVFLKETMGRFTPIDDARLPIPHNPLSHPILQRAIQFLCRDDGDVGGWSFMACHVMDYVQLCYSDPEKLFTAAIDYLVGELRERGAKIRPISDLEKKDEGLFTILKMLPDSEAPCLIRFFFILGHSALKRMNSIDLSEKEQLRLLDDAARAAPHTRGSRSSPRSSAGVPGANADGGGAEPAQVDVMVKELGMVGAAHRRYELQQRFAKLRADTVCDKENFIWARFADLPALCLAPLSSKTSSPTDADACAEAWTDEHSPDYKSEAKSKSEVVGHLLNIQPVRTAAVTCLAKLCVTSEEMCKKHVGLLFRIVSSPLESWVTRTNTVIAMGDLLCLYPNSIEPYMEAGTSGLYGLLSDTDPRVRSVTIQVCTFLVLNDMLKVRDHLHRIVRLIADPCPDIAFNAHMFVCHFAEKQKRNISNIIPPLVLQLSDYDSVVAAFEKQGEGADVGSGRRGRKKQSSVKKEGGDGMMPQEHFQLAMKLLIEKVEGEKAIGSLIERLCASFTRYVDESASGYKAKVFRCLAHNLAYCISVIDATSERVMKRLISEKCYAGYKQWLRDPYVLMCFQTVATRAKRSTGLPFGAGERRDKSIINEWVAKMERDAAPHLHHSAKETALKENEDPQEESPDASPGNEAES